MPRKPRVDEDGGRHHVMNRGAGRQDIFRCDADRLRFLTCLRTALHETGVCVESYCLMGNHFHLGVYCPQGGLSDMMQRLSANYTRWFNTNHATDGPLFRGRFKSVPIPTEQYLIHVTRYIHLNPRDIGCDPATYAWSSCAGYLGLRALPGWVTPDLPLELSGGPDGVAQLLCEAPPLVDEAAIDERPSHVFGNWMASQNPTLADVKDAFGGERGTRLAEPSRTAAIALTADLGWFEPEALCAAFGFATVAGYRSAVKRARRKVKADSEMYVAYAQAEERLRVTQTVSDTVWVR